MTPKQPVDRDKQHPVDRDIRALLTSLILRNTSMYTQQGIAKRIGRSQGWLNKYVNGTGHATIDDLLRLFAVIYELTDQMSPAMTEKERRFLRTLRRLSAEAQDQLMLFADTLAKHGRRSRSSEREGHKNRATGDKGSGTR